MWRFYLILLAGFSYLGIRLSSGLGLWFWALLSFVMVGVLLFPSDWLRKSSMNRFQHVFRWKVYLDIGFICFLLSFTLLRDFFYGVFRLIKPEWALAYFGDSSSSIVLILSFSALFVGMWTALRGPKIKPVKIPIENLPQGLEGYRIAQISDLHIGPTIGSRYVKNVVRKVNSLNPHMTVLTGDIVDGHVEDHLHVAHHLKELSPLEQTIFVPGNHEYYWNGPRWIKEFESMGLEVLQNSRKVVRHQGHEILVAGVLDPASAMAHPNNKPDIKKALGSNYNSDVKILLAHQPNIAFEAAKEGFHLLISGHTHAGQFFPFTLFIFSFQKFVKGLMSYENMWIYVNQGTGYWGPPIRLGTVTEITLLELTAKSSSSASKQAAAL